MKESYDLATPGSLYQQLELRVQEGSLGLRIGRLAALASPVGTFALPPTLVSMLVKLLKETLRISNLPIVHRHVYYGFTIFY